MKRRGLLAALALVQGLAFGLPADAAIAPQEPLSNLDLTTWLETFSALNTSGDDLSVALIDHLNVLNQLIQTPADIQTFRDWDRDDEVVKPLIPLAGGSHSETRVPATLVLGNVVDNTNVCHVIAYLANNAAINASGRVNLLQVALQVAPYASNDVAGWMTTLTSQLRSDLPEKSDVGRTLSLLDRIEERLSGREPAAPLQSMSPPRYIDCLSVLPERYTLTADPESLAAATIVSIERLTVATLRDQLFSDGRREYAAAIASLHARANDASKAKLVDALVGTIIQPGDDPDRRYRVNLYVALTLSKAEMQNAVTVPEQQQTLRELKHTAEYRSDSTFRENVDAALSRQSLS